jgi:hypothetical protein
MNGVQHYREAERLLAQTQRGGETHESRRDLVATASVHALLAVAEATARISTPTDITHSDGTP